MDESEAVAKLVVEYALRDLRLQFVEDQSVGSHDFDMIRGNRTIGLVEVTSAKDGAKLSATAAIFKEKVGGNPIAVRKCERVWMLDVKKCARIKPLRTSVGPLLRALEEEDIRAFSCETILGSEPVAQLSHLGIASGRWYPATGPGRAYLQLAEIGSLVSADAVLDALVFAAEREDNRKKLGAAKFEERHLFLYIHHSASEAWIGLQVMSMPAAAPTLPNEVSSYWVASHDFESESIIYWRGNQTGWLEQGVVPVHTSK